MAFSRFSVGGLKFAALVRRAFAPLPATDVCDVTVLEEPELLDKRTFEDDASVVLVGSGISTNPRRWFVDPFAIVRTGRWLGRKKEKRVTALLCVVL